MAYRETPQVRKILAGPGCQARLVVINCIEQSVAAERLYRGERLPRVTKKTAVHYLKHKQMDRFYGRRRAKMLAAERLRLTLGLP